MWLKIRRCRLEVFAAKRDNYKSGGRGPDVMTVHVTAAGVYMMVILEILMKLKWYTIVS